MHFDSGFLAHFHVNWLAPVKIRQMLLGGRQRMLVYDDIDPSEKVRVYDKGVDFDATRDDETRRQILVSYRTGDMYAPKLDRREALALVAQEFAAAIAERRAPLTDAAPASASSRCSRRPSGHCARRAGGSRCEVSVAIAADVRLGKDVTIFEFVNLYGCEIGDETRIGTFVEIQRGAKVGRRVQGLEPHVHLRRRRDRRPRLCRPRRDVHQR